MMGRLTTPPKEIRVFNAQQKTSAIRNAFPIAAAMALFAVVVSLALSGCGGAAQKDSFSAYSWSELSAISKEISEATSDSEGIDIAIGYHLLDSGGKLDGKTKSVTLSDGTEAHVMIAGVRQDDLADGGKAGLTLVFADAPAVHAMNSESSNEGGWEKSEMRSWLNDEFLGMLPSDLKGAIKAASKKTDNSASTTPGAVSSTSDKLWLLSLTEIIGSVPPNDLVGGSGIPAETYNAEGKQYKLFADKKVAAGDANSALERKFVGDDSEGSGIVVTGEASPWWQRSLSTTWTAGFESTTADGDPLNAWIADYALGVSPGFCL